LMGLSELMAAERGIGFAVVWNACFSEVINLIKY